jgi:transcription-repair coupling factor (superfamily II helicase)
MAEKLLELYAARKTAQGFAFTADGNWQREFEDAFEFEETQDQNLAIADIKRDMEKPVPMDRLLCGDVGYGKTEVAMPAAFKVISDGKQVAVLAPTTVLAFQHFETFKKRFAAFPAKIEMLSRFRTAAEQKKILAELEAGKVDVVIGTHRLLSKDVNFQDLGLLVIDEEQRFGVAHKERLKEMRKDVDALSLSATPIPRTLHCHRGIATLLHHRDAARPIRSTDCRAPFQERLIRRQWRQSCNATGRCTVHNAWSRSFAIALVTVVPRARVVGNADGQKELRVVQRR